MCIRDSKYPHYMQVQYSNKLIVGHCTTWTDVWAATPFKKALHNKPDLHNQILIYQYSCRYDSGVNPYMQEEERIYWHPHQLPTSAISAWHTISHCGLRMNQYFGSIGVDLSQAKLCVLRVGTRIGLSRGVTVLGNAPVLICLVNSKQSEF